MIFFMRKLTPKMENNEFPKVLHLVVPPWVRFIPTEIHVYSFLFYLPEEKNPRTLWLKANWAWLYMYIYTKEFFRLLFFSEYCFGTPKSLCERKQCWKYSIKTRPLRKFHECQTILIFQNIFIIKKHVF